MASEQPVAPSQAAPPLLTAQPTARIDNVEHIELADLLPRVHKMAEGGYRLVTITCVDVGAGFEIIYHFDKDLTMQHFSLQLPVEVKLPSITSEYLCAFLVENEMCDLFGLEVEGLPLDYRSRLVLTEDSLVHPLIKQH